MHNIYCEITWLRICRIITIDIELHIESFLIYFELHIESFFYISFIRFPNIHYNQYRIY